MTNRANKVSIQPPPRKRLLIGGFIFITGFFAPLAIPLVTSSALPIVWKTGLSGLLALGVPEFLMLIAVSILGKPGFTYLKSTLWRFIAPPETVSLVRYRLGLVMFWLPILFIWIYPYLEDKLAILAEQRVMLLGLASTGLMLVSLHVLGGEFWDKLRGLFTYNMTVIKIDEVSATTAIVPDETVAPPMSRLLLGGICFGLSLLLPVFIPLLGFLPISGEARTVLGGLMVFGIPQVLMVITVSILGKPGFAYLKQRLAGFFAGFLAKQVSRQRYRLGLLFFTIPILLGFCWPYLNIIFTDLSIYKYEIAIVGDILLFAALFILGEGFWEKLKSLFVHRSRVVPTTE